MFLKGVIKLKKGPSKITRFRKPWVYSNELENSDRSLDPGSWVSLESSAGETIGYGFYNPHSLISFRLFESGKFRNEEQTRALFFKRMDWAYRTRLRAYSKQITTGEMGKNSFRLAFGESDGLPGLVIDLFDTLESKAYPVVQCHSAGSDQLILWMQQWFDEKMSVQSGLLRNDIPIRDLEKTKRENIEWGNAPKGIHALEGGVRFFLNPLTGQKTGYFYDLRDHRSVFANRMSSFQNDDVEILDCFSYVGAWGLQVLKKSSKAKLIAVDISRPALETLLAIALENGLQNRVETVEADFFKEKNLFPGKKFKGIVMDPPATSSSSKHSDQTIKSHEKCFYEAMRFLHDDGVLAMAACSYHFSREDFLNTIARASQAWNRSFKISHDGTQAADHPYLAQFLESNYIKCVMGEWLMNY